MGYVVLCGLPAVGKSTLARRWSALEGVVVSPEKSDRVDAPPRTGRPGSQRAHLEVDLARMLEVTALRRPGSVVVSVNDATAAFAFAFALRETQEDTGRFSQCLELYGPPLESGAISPAACYVHVQIDDHLRRARRSMDAAHPRSDLFFDPPFATAFDSFFVLLANRLPALHRLAVSGASTNPAGIMDDVRRAMWTGDAPDGSELLAALKSLQ